MPGHEIDWRDWKRRYVVWFLISLILTVMAARWIVEAIAKPPLIACTAPEGTLPWPIAGDTVLGHGWQQLISSAYGDDIHDGLDIMATLDPPTEILAVEDGVVVYESYPEHESHYSFIVESNDKPGIGVRYIHVDYDTRKVDPFDSSLTSVVSAGDPLGYVTKYPVEALEPPSGATPDSFDHLHVELVEKVSYGGSGKWDSFARTGNPLERLLAPDDGADPSIGPVPTSCPSSGQPQPFLFCLDDDDLFGSNYVDTYVCPDELVEGMKLDIVANVQDQPHSPPSSWALPPYCTQTRIEGTGDPIVLVQTWDGAIQDETLQRLYKLDGQVKSESSVTKREMYLVLTNRSDANGAWEPKAGDYTITVTVRDPTGREAVQTMDVTVGPSN